MMIRANPMSGPAYIIALRNALASGKRPGEYSQPPKQRGGPQISVRFDDFQFNHIDAIAEKSEWNRSEVINALIQRGLFDLYEFSDRETVDEIVRLVVSKAPSQPAARLEPQAIEYCQLNGNMLDGQRYPYPIGHETSPEACLAVAQHLLNSWWRLIDGKLEPMSKVRPLPELIRIIDIGGGEICSWSVNDMRAS
jgi:hypothetical protein